MGAGQMGVDANAQFGALDGGRFSQSDHGVLRSDIRRHQRGADKTGNGSRIDNRAGSALAHNRDDMFQPEKHPFDVDVQYGREIGIRLFDNRSDLSFNARIIEKNIDFAESVHRFPHIVALDTSAAMVT